MGEPDLKQVVKDKYGETALRVSTGESSCCSASSTRGACDPITSNLYESSETAALPAEAVAASLGCGNPTALAELKPGETVLDLGSGGGIDVLLSAKRVGASGKAFGLDMTDEMLALARENQRKAGVKNVEFLKGEIEAIPLPENSVDVIISNCVINLSADKDRVFSEALRVLRPGGRLAVSDVVVRGEVPPQIRRSIELWIGCVAGALEEEDYRAKLAKAGFEAITLEPTRIYRMEDAREFLSRAGIDAEAIASQVDGKFMSAFVRASKPAATSKPGREGAAMQRNGQSESPIAVSCSAMSGETTSGNTFPGPLPVRRRLTTLFVDIAGSTSLLVHYSPETVLGVVQCFMRLVTDVAYDCSGSVKDYEGDGALLYFESTRDAVRAATRIRAELEAGRCNANCGGGPGVAARMSITVGEVVVGVVGSSMRQAVALVGPSVNVGARLLKQIPSGGIIASGEVIEALRAEDPNLATEFRLLDHAFEVPGGDGVRVATYEVRRSRQQPSAHQAAATTR